MGEASMDGICLGLLHPPNKQMKSASGLLLAQLKPQPKL